MKSWTAAFPFVPGAVAYFRKFFALKILVFFLSNNVPGFSVEYLGLLLIVGFGAFFACFDRWHRIGILLLLAFAGIGIGGSFDTTPNHKFVECLFLLILLAFHSDGEARMESERLQSALFQCIILIVWFYSGVQKVVHGYFLNGELMAMYMYFDQTRLAATLRSVSDLELFRLQTNLGPLGFEKTPLGITPMVRFICVGFARVVTVTEIVLPILAVFRRTQCPAVVALIVMMVLIWFFSGIASFAFTSLACFLLFFPASAKRNFSILGGILALYTASLL
jgi:hypothetical protein